MVRKALHRNSALAAVLIVVAATGPRLAPQQTTHAFYGAEPQDQAAGCPHALKPGPDAIQQVLLTTRTYLVVFGQRNNGVHYQIDGRVLFDLKGVGGDGTS